MGILNHHVAAAALSTQSHSLPLTAANLCNRARWVMNNLGTDAAVLDALIAKRNADRAREEEVAASAAEAAAREQDQKRIDARHRDERRRAKARKRAWERQLRKAEEQHQALNDRSEEHTSELQSLMRISYAVFCLKKKNTKQIHAHTYTNEY